MIKMKMRVSCISSVKNYLHQHDVNNVYGLDLNDEQKILEMYSQEEIENFRMIFIMFDPDKTGFVGV